jgi:hypothetical protein
MYDQHRSQTNVNAVDTTGGDSEKEVWETSVLYLTTHSVAYNTVETGYNDIDLCDTSSIALDILWYQLIPPFDNNILLFC